MRGASRGFLLGDFGDVRPVPVALRSRRRRRFAPDENLVKLILVKLLVAVRVVGHEPALQRGARVFVHVPGAVLEVQAEGLRQTRVLAKGRDELADGEFPVAVLVDLREEVIHRERVDAHVRHDDDLGPHRRRLRSVGLGLEEHLGELLHAELLIAVSVELDEKRLERSAGVVLDGPRAQAQPKSQRLVSPQREDQLGLGHAAVVILIDLREEFADVALHRAPRELLHQSRIPQLVLAAEDALKLRQRERPVALAVPPGKKLRVRLPRRGIPAAGAHAVHRHPERHLKLGVSLERFEDLSNLRVLNLARGVHGGEHPLEVLVGGQRRGDVIGQRRRGSARSKGCVKLVQLKPRLVVDVVPGEEFLDLFPGAVPVLDLPVGEPEAESLAQPAVLPQRHRELAHGHHAVAVGVDLREQADHRRVHFAKGLRLDPDFHLRLPHRRIAHLGEHLVDDLLGGGRRGRRGRRGDGRVDPRLEVRLFHLVLVPVELGLWVDLLE